MGKFFGITKSRSDSVKNANLVGASIVNGHLVLTKGDGTTLDLGLASADILPLTPALVTLSEFDSPAQQVVVPDWAPGSTTIFGGSLSPNTAPAGNMTGPVAWSPSGKYLAIATDASPYIQIYSRSGSTLTKLANPATLPGGTVWSLGWSSDGQYLAYGGSTEPLRIYKRSGTTFTMLATPSGLIGANITALAWSPDTTYLAIGGTTSPYFQTFKRSGDTFTALANPATMPGGNVPWASFAANGTYLAIGTSASPYVIIYKRSGDVFTKLTNPATIPAGTSGAGAWSPDAQYLLIGKSTAGPILYKRSGDVFTKLADPAILNGGVIQSAAWSPDGRYVACGSSASTYLVIYRLVSDTLVATASPQQASSIVSNIYGVAFSPEGDHLAMAYSISGNLGFKSSMAPPQGVPVATTILS